MNHFLLFMWVWQFQRVIQNLSRIKYISQPPNSLHEWKRMLGILIFCVHTAHSGCSQATRSREPLAAHYHPHHRFLPPRFCQCNLSGCSPACVEMSQAHSLSVAGLCRSILVCPNWNREWLFERLGQQDEGQHFSEDFYGQGGRGVPWPSKAATEMGQPCRYLLVWHERAGQVLYCKCSQLQQKLNEIYCPIYRLLPCLINWSSAFPQTPVSGKCVIALSLSFLKSSLIN